MMIRKLFKAEMAHLVPGAYTTRCHHLHGHSYKFELFISSPKPDQAHMVVDFKAVKDIGISDFFDSFDHSVMIWEKDPRVRWVKKMNPERFLIVPFIPTAEMIAKASFEVCSIILKTSSLGRANPDLKIHHVIVHETDTGYASFGIEDLEADRFPISNIQRWTISDGIKSDWMIRKWYKTVRFYKSKSPIL